MTTLNKNEEFLADIPLPEIAEVFASFGSEEEARVTIIPIGFPAAGKCFYHLCFIMQKVQKEKSFLI